MNSHDDPSDHHDASDSDVVIVGGGLAGLLAAIAAAKAGAAVTILERGQLGGRARSRLTGNEPGQGFCLNHGAHALYVGLALDRALRGFGVTPQGGAPSQRGARGLLDGRLGQLPVGPGSLIATDLVPARAKFQLARQMAAIPRLDPTEYRHQTIDEWIASRGVHPSIGRLMAALVHVTSYCADTDIGSAEAAIVQMQAGLSTGVLYLDNGWQQLVDALTKAALELGVEVRNGCRVRQVEATSVRLDDDTVVRAGSVVLAGLSPTMVSELVAGAPDLTTAAGPAVETANLDIGARGNTSTGFVLGLDEPVYLNRHSPPAQLAPPDHTLHSALHYLRRDDDHDHGAVADRLLRLAHQAGLSPNSIVETWYSHRLRVADGQPVAARGGLAGRPGVLAAGVPGVFLAGDWIGPHGLLADASAASALSAAEQAVDYARARAATR